MRRPLPQAEQNQIDLKSGFSKAAQQQMARKAGRTKPSTGNYTVIDLETTGLKAASDPSSNMERCGSGTVYRWRS